MRVLVSLALCLSGLSLLGGCVVKEKETVREEPVVEKRVEVRDRPVVIERPAEVKPNKVEVNVDK
jgi:hypothetical protein